jgi:hypothetical protein
MASPLVGFVPGYHAVTIEALKICCPAPGSDRAAMPVIGRAAGGMNPKRGLDFRIHLVAGASLVSVPWSHSSVGSRILRRSRANRFRQRWLIFEQSKR